MVILIIGKFSQDQFGFHISDSLKDMGHQTIEFDPTVKYKYSKTVFERRVYQVKAVLINNLINTSWYRQFRVRRLKYILEKNKIDLTITTHDFLYPEEVTLIREKTKSPLVMWFPDSVSGFNKAFFLISDYDFLFFKDPYIVKTLTENYNKKNVYYLPECCNPKFHKSISLTEEDLNKYGCDITTYGSPHNVRTSFFSQLLNYQYDIKIWGHQPSIWLKDKKLKSLYTGEYIFNESKAKSVLAAKININTLHPSEVIGLNARTFEIAGIGGFQMIHWRQGLADLFKDGKELVSFKNFDELIQKVNYYLSNEKERNEIAKAGQKRAYGYHTYELRMKLIFETINGKAKGYEFKNYGWTN